MSFVAVAVGGIGAIAGSAISSGASRNAAQTQAQANQNALDFQKQVYQTERTNAQPYIDAGTSALGTLQADLPQLTAGFSPSANGLPSSFSYGPNDFHADPGYAFAVAQGQKAIENSAAARGGDVSGGTLKSLDAYTTGMADQDYANAYGRALGTYQQNYSNAFNTYETNQQNTFNRLGSLVNTGMAANSQAAQAGQNFANNAGNYAINSGNALAAGIVGSANAINAGISGATGGLANSIFLNRILGQQANQSGYVPNAFNNAMNFGNATTSLNNLGPSPYTGGYTDGAGDFVVTQ